MASLGDIVEGNEEDFAQKRRDDTAIKYINVKAPHEQVRRVLFTVQIFEYMTLLLNTVHYLHENITNEFNTVIATLSNN